MRLVPFIFPPEGINVNESYVFKRGVSRFTPYFENFLMFGNEKIQRTQNREKHKTYVKLPLYLWNITNTGKPLTVTVKGYGDDDENKPLFLHASFDDSRRMKISIFTWVNEGMKTTYEKNIKTKTQTKVSCILKGLLRVRIHSNNVSFTSKIQIKEKLKPSSVYNEDIMEIGSIISKSLWNKGASLTVALKLSVSVVEMVKEKIEKFMFDIDKKELNNSSQNSTNISLNRIISSKKEKSKKPTAITYRIFTPHCLFDKIIGFGLIPSHEFLNTCKNKELSSAKTIRSHATIDDLIEKSNRMFTPPIRECTETHNNYSDCNSSSLSSVEMSKIPFFEVTIPSNVSLKSVLPKGPYSHYEVLWRRRIDDIIFVFAGEIGTHSYTINETDPDEISTGVGMIYRKKNRLSLKISKYDESSTQKLKQDNSDTGSSEGDIHLADEDVSTFCGNILLYNCRLNQNDPKILSAISSQCFPLSRTFIHTVPILIKALLPNSIKVLHYLTVSLDTNIEALTDVITPLYIEAYKRNVYLKNSNDADGGFLKPFNLSNEEKRCCGTVLYGEDGKKYKKVRDVPSFGKLRILIMTCGVMPIPYLLKSHEIVIECRGTYISACLQDSLLDVTKVLKTNLGEEKLGNLIVEKNDNKYKIGQPFEHLYEIIPSVATYILHVYYIPSNCLESAINASREFRLHKYHVNNAKPFNILIPTFTIEQYGFKIPVIRVGDLVTEYEAKTKEKQCIIEVRKDSTVLCERRNNTSDKYINVRNILNGEESLFIKNIAPSFD